MPQKCVKPEWQPCLKVPQSLNESQLTCRRLAVVRWKKFTLRHMENDQLAQRCCLFHLPQSTAEVYNLYPSVPAGDHRLRSFKTRCQSLVHLPANKYCGTSRIQHAATRMGKRVSWHLVLWGKQGITRAEPRKGIIRWQLQRTNHFLPVIAAFFTRRNSQSRKKISPACSGTEQCCCDWSTDLHSPHLCSATLLVYWTARHPHLDRAPANCRPSTTQTSRQAFVRSLRLELHLKPLSPPIFFYFFLPGILLCACKDWQWWFEGLSVW